MAKRALYQKNLRTGNTTQSLDGIIGSARGDVDGDNIPIQLGDRALIIEDEIEYIYRYIDYAGVVDDDVYIRPFTDPDSSKAWFLTNDPGLKDIYSDKINWKVGARSIGSDFNTYKCFIKNGPNNLPVVDPVEDTTKTWKLTATPQVDARHCIQSLGNGITFSGMTITIASDIDNPFMSTLAAGFLNGQKNYQTVLYEDTDLVFTEGDGSYTFSVDYLGNFTFEVVRPDFDSTPGVMKSSVKKLPLGDVTVAGSVITVLDLMPVGDYYDVDWFLVGVNTNYPFDNRFQDPNVTLKAYWNSSQSEEGRYIVPHMYTSNLGGAGAALQTSTLTLNILTGAYATFYFNGGGAPSINETAGYYSFTVKRGF